MDDATPVGHGWFSVVTQKVLLGLAELCGNMPTYLPSLEISYCMFITCETAVAAQGKLAMGCHRWPCFRRGREY